jgi:hypothetical protein
MGNGQSISHQFQTLVFYWNSASGRLLGGPLFSIDIQLQRARSSFRLPPGFVEGGVAFARLPLGAWLRWLEKSAIWLQTQQE